MRIIHPTYSSARPGPVIGKLRQSVAALGRNAKTINQRKPRRGFCVPTNQTPSRAPVQAPKSGMKKPRTKRLATAQAAIYDQRVNLTFVDILRFSFLRRALHAGVVDLTREVQASLATAFVSFDCGFGAASRSAIVSVANA